MDTSNKRKWCYIMIKGFYGGNYEMPIPFSNWDNFDKILDLLDDYIERKEQVEEKNKGDLQFNLIIRSRHD